MKGEVGGLAPVREVPGVEVVADTVRFGVARHGVGSNWDTKRYSLTFKVLPDACSN